LTIWADGSSERKFLDTPAFDYNATFAADGQSIVFTSERNGDGNSDVFRCRDPPANHIARITSKEAFSHRVGQTRPWGDVRSIKAAVQRTSGCLESVLQKAQKNASIHSSSGVIRGIPV
jgi:Tol biopolymer transport system component